MLRHRFGWFIKSDKNSGVVFRTRWNNCEDNYSAISEIANCSLQFLWCPVSPSGWRGWASPAMPSRTADCPPPEVSPQPERWFPSLHAGSLWIAGTPVWPSGLPPEPVGDIKKKLRARNCCWNMATSQNKALISSLTWGGVWLEFPLSSHPLYVPL